MSKLFDELTALKKQYEEKMANEGEAALKEAFKELFDKHPRLESVMWTQYTPYFNDGDPCYFGVNDFDPVLFAPKEDSEDSEEKEEFYDDSYSYGDRLYHMKKSKDEELKKIAKDVSDLNSNIPADVLEQVFGDHCKVVATRKGFDVREWSHD